jgi:hypothetical protein
MAFTKKGSGNAEGRQSRPQATYTNADFSSYDGLFSALSFMLINQSTTLQLAPIDPAMIGKQPKKGERVYDYDNKLTVMLNAPFAMQLQKAFEYITDPELDAEVTQITVSTGVEGNSRAVTIFRPGAVKLKVAGKSTQFDENYLMKIEITKDGDTTRAYHVMQNSVITFGMKNAEGVKSEDEVTIEHDIEIIKQVCQRVIDTALGLSRHGATQAVRMNGGGSSPARKKNAFQGVEEGEDDGGSDGGDSEEEDGNTSKNGKKQAVKSTLAAEFGEGEDDDIPY